MRRGLIVLVVVSLLSGCVSYRASSMTAKVGAGIAVLGLVIAGVTLAQAHNHAAYSAMVVGGVVAGPGVVLGLGGLLGMAVHRALEEDPPATQVEVDAECLRHRRAQRGRAHAIADREQRTTALVALPVCGPASRVNIP